MPIYTKEFEKWWDEEVSIIPKESPHVALVVIFKEIAWKGWQAALQSMKVKR